MLLDVMHSALGTILSLVAAIIPLIFVHELGHLLAMKWRAVPVEAFGIGWLPPYWVFGRWGETELRFSPWLIGGYALPAEGGMERSAAWEKVVILLAGVVFNAIFAVLITIALLCVHGVPTAVPSVQGFSPANTIGRDAGFASGDVVVSVAGQPTNTAQAVASIISKHPGDRVEVGVERAGAAVRLTVTPDSSGKIGVMLGGTLVSLGAGQGILAALILNAEIAMGTLTEMGQAFSRPDQVHSVVGIAEESSYQLNQGSYRFGIWMVSLSWALIWGNLLPIPILDGGRVLLVLVEAVKRKPLSETALIRASAISYVLIIGLLGLGLFNDLFNSVSVPN
jgi:regulator of sigma E protease